MPEHEKDLGKLVAIYGLEPAYLQRSVFIVVLSFLFFLGMMFAFYVRQNFIYFLLASAFLLLYLITLFSFVFQRRSVLKIFEGGVSFKQHSALWGEITRIEDTGVIALSNRKEIVLPRVLTGRESAIGQIRVRCGLTQ